MRILVVGGRNYHNYAKVCEVLDSRPWEGLLRWYKPASVIITGGAPGADSLALRWAMERKVPYELYEPRWKIDGHGAVCARDQRMIDDGKPDLVIQFAGHEGTIVLVGRAKHAGIKVHEVSE